MAQKIGGGKRMENYDPKTGKYCSNSNTNSKLEEFDPFFKIEMSNLLSPYWKNKDNAKKLVDYIKNKKIDKFIKNSKIEYLLKYSAKNDKSIFLKEKLGYDNVSLLNDIRKNTDFERMMYAETSEYGIKIIACTKLRSKSTNKDYLTTSVWQLENINKLNFITLYPGGEKLWDFIYMKK